MSPISTSGGYHFCRLTGGEHISRLVETRRGKKIFLQSKNFLLMRYKVVCGFSVNFYLTTKTALSILYIGIYTV